MSEINTVTMTVINGCLKITNIEEKIRYNNFIENLKEGATLTQYTEVINPDATNAQLAKVHKCIRTIATYTGNTFIETKKDIKRRCGMLIVSVDTELEVSFAKINKDDMNLAIQACIELGDELNINLR